MKVIISVLLNALSIYLGSVLLAGVHIESLWAAVVTGIVLGIANIIVKPIIILLTLPITIVTLGIFLFFINALVLAVVDWLVPGFNLDGFLWAFVLSVLMMLLNLVYSMLNLKRN